MGVLRKSIDRDDYSEQMAKTLDRNTKQLVDNNTRLSEKGIRKLMIVSNDSGNNIEVSIDSNINFDSKLNELIHELDMIGKGTKDQAEYNLEKEFGYDVPNMPKSDAEHKVHKIIGVFDEMNDDPNYDPNQKRVDYLEAKQIMNESINKTMDNAKRIVRKNG